MTSWQKRTRIGLAIFGVVFGAIVYRSIGERRAPPPAAPVQRLDPKAVLETTEGELERLRQTEQDFSVKSARSLTYEDGSIKSFEVEITRKASERTYVVTAAEALVGKNQKEKQLSGQVAMSVSDGFRLTTERATHSDDQGGVVRAPGSVAFSKGRMTGSGANATYDQGKDLLTIAENAKVTIADEAGKTATDFSSGTAILDRVQNVLTLNQKAHVLRSEQEIDADNVTARLSDDEQIIRYIELRGNARVKGGTSIDAMSARDIDLDYTDDGHALERVLLKGSAELAIGGSEGPGRRIAGESLDLQLAPDGSLLSVNGRDMVSLDLPATKDTPAGSIRADALDGTGEEGRGLTLAEFRGNVEYREPGQRGAKGRVVRSQNLSASLADDAVTKAVFTGTVTFDDEGIGAHAAEVRYQPRENAITLGGSDASGIPHVSLDQIAIDARTIDVALDDRRITARDVKTTLSPRPPAKGAAGQGTTTSGGVALPGLLRQNEPANINADALDYRGKSGRAVYTGRAALLQGETAIRADSITLDQEKGSLIATGSARSTLELDTGRSTGQGHEIRYDDALRTVTYSGAALAPTSERGSAPAGAGGAAPAGGRRAVPARDAQLSGPQGNLHGERIEIILARDGNQVERLEAYGNVTLRLDTRTGVGDRLTYHAKGERYVMSGTSTAPVRITTTSEASAGVRSCRETTGRTLTFYKSTDTIIVDGNEEKRTETQMKPCTPPSSR